MKRFILFILFISLAHGQQSFEKRMLLARQFVFPALVHIQPVKEYFSGGEKHKVQVTGSGVIISADGYVVTNNHVAERATLVRCILSSREEVTAKVIGLDAWTDIAVLKLDLKTAKIKNVPFADFGNSDSLQVGQIVMAMGSPLGLARSLSMGVVSSIDRYFNDVGEMISPFNLWIQTDAAINPGNSGGPLVDLDGKVIGINARAVTFGQNLGFAIPSNIVRKIVDQIIATGSVNRSYTGLNLQEIKEYRRYTHRPELSGVLISGVDENSPAQDAGFKPGDIVTAINGKPVNAIHREELPKIRLLMAGLPVGSKALFRIERGGHTQQIILTTTPRGKLIGNEFNGPEWGISVQEITPRIKKNFRLLNTLGVLVIGVKEGSLADKAGISRGDIIKTIDEDKVLKLTDFEKLYKKLIKSPLEDHLLFLKAGTQNRFALIEGDKKDD